MAKVTGIGGFFLKGADPAAIREWYARVLGFEVNEWGGAMFSPAPDASQQWCVFDGDSDYTAPSTLPLMVNLVVDDLDALQARIMAEGIEILDRQDGEYGKFAWVIDPVGIKLELWQPPS